MTLMHKYEAPDGKTENFFTYSMIGNVAFLLYSGGYTYEDAKPHFMAGCAWLKEAKPDVTLLQVTGMTMSLALWDVEQR